MQRSSLYVFLSVTLICLYFFKYIEQKSPEAVFTYIYKSKHWGDKGLGSGTGSSIEFTQIARQYLHEFFYTYKIESMVDAPCGSFAWMRILMANNTQIQYTGVDVVPFLINGLRKEFEGVSHLRFEHADLSGHQYSFPRNVDLIFTRDALQHLPFEKVYQILRNIRAARPKYAIIGGYADGANKNVNVGGYFCPKWDASPFLLGSPMILFKEKFHPVEQKYLYVYNLSQLEKWNL